MYAQGRAAKVIALQQAGMYTMRKTVWNSVPQPAQVYQEMQRRQAMRAYTRKVTPEIKTYIAKQMDTYTKTLTREKASFEVADEVETVFNVTVTEEYIRKIYRESIS